MKTLSVVLPVYQNALNLPDTFASLSRELARCGPDVDYELVFVNDGSTDESLARLIEIQAQDPARVSVVNLVRNFGQVPALLAGFAQARGDCVVVISADLQDPPELILRMVEEWRRGQKLVVAVRESRQDTFVASVASRIFYSLMRAMSLPQMPTGGFDFFLMDRQLVDIVSRMEEANPFVQGLVLWPGFQPLFIPYQRRKRKAGRSQWSLTRKVKYFIDGFVGYSFVPIRLVSISGISLFFLGILGAVLVVAQRLLFGTRLQGWSSLMAVILTLSGLQMLMLGVLGEYLWRTFDQARRRPLYLVERVIGASRNGSDD